MEISSSEVVVGELLVLVVSSEGSDGDDANGCGRSALGVTRVVLLLLSLLGGLIEKGSGSRLLHLESMRRGGVRSFALLAGHLL